MLFILLFLLSKSNAFTSEVFNVIARDYIPNPSNEDFKYNENMDTHTIKPSNFIDTAKNIDMIKYNELLSLLHNEKSNQVVLAHMGNKGRLEPGAAAIVRGIEDRTRGKRDDEENEDYDNLQDLKRSKRSAMNWLKNLVHKETFTEPPTTKQNISMYLREGNDINVNSTITNLIEDLTMAIKTLNQNLVNLKLQVFLIKMPGDEDVEDNAQKGEINHINFTRSKRHLAHQIFGNRKVTEKHESMQQTKVDSKIISSLQSINSNSNHIISNKTKREINETITVDDNAENKSTTDAALPVSEDNDAESNNDNFTESDMSLTEVIDKLDDLNHDKSSETSNVLATYSIANNTEMNPGQPLNTNTSSQMRSGNRDLVTYDVTKTSSNDRVDLLFYIDQAYKDIKDKIIPMKSIKYKYSSLIMYKIGYIVANLDTLEVSLKKLMNKLYIRKDNWNNKQLLRVYRKLNLSRNLVDNIMDYLNTYAANEQFGMSRT